MLDYVEVGKRIRRARTEKRITQEKFAELIGVSTGYISQIESGLKCFNLKRFKQAGVIFDKPVSYFIEGSACEDEDSLREIVGILTNANKEQINIVKKIVQAIVD